MSIACNITIDQIVNAMVAQIAPLAPIAGGAVSDAQPIYFVDRYMGELRAIDGQRRGIAGRCPAVLIAWAGTKTVKTTVSRRRDQLESTFMAIVCSDSVRSKDDRSKIFGILNLVILNLGARSLGLEMQPLRFQAITDVVEDETIFANAARFTTRHHIDYTQDVTGTMTSVYGQFNLPSDDDFAPGATIVELQKDFTA